MLWGFGILAYLLFCLILTPASLWLKLVSLPASVQLGPVSGTLWSGQIQGVQQGAWYLPQLSWQLQLSSLWRGQLGLLLSGGELKDQDQPYLKLQAKLSPGAVTVTQSVLRLPMAGLMSQLQLPMPVDASGELVLNLQQLTLGQPYCNALSGNASWQQARFKSPIGWLDLRQIDAKLSCEQGNLRLVTLPDNPLALAITADVMAGRYQLNGTLKPDASMPKEVHDAMRFVSQPDANGRYSIQFGGQIRVQ